jgi:hypothetical protein
MKLQAGRLGQYATETKHANRSPVTRPVLANYWRSLNCATTKRYIPKHITKGETEMTENEYHETFDMQMEREHQETVARMQEFQTNRRTDKQDARQPPKLEIEVRYLMGIIKEVRSTHQKS